MLLSIFACDGETLTAYCNFKPFTGHVVIIRSTDGYSGTSDGAIVAMVDNDTFEAAVNNYGAPHDSIGDHFFVNEYLLSKPHKLSFPAGWAFTHCAECGSEQQDADRYHERCSECRMDARPRCAGCFVRMDDENRNGFYCIECDPLPDDEFPGRELERSGRRL